MNRSKQLREQARYQTDLAWAARLMDEATKVEADEMVERVANAWQLAEIKRLGT